MTDRTAETVRCVADGHPTSQWVISAAQNNGAPEGLIGMLGSLSRPEYSGPEQVADDLRAFPQSS